MTLLTWRYGRRKAQCCTDFGYCNSQTSWSLSVFQAVHLISIYGGLLLVLDLLRHCAGHIAVYKYLIWIQLRSQLAYSRSNTTRESCASLCFPFEVNRVHCCCFCWSILLLWFRLVPLIKRYTKVARKVTEEFWFFLVEPRLNKSVIFWMTWACHKFTLCTDTDSNTMAHNF